MIFYLTIEAAVGWMLVMVCVDFENLEIFRDIFLPEDTLL